MRNNPAQFNHRVCRELVTEVHGGDVTYGPNSAKPVFELYLDHFYKLIDKYKKENNIE